MHRLLSFLLGMLLVVMVGAQATAHVVEPFKAMNPVEAAFAGHTAGDADEVPADGDKGYPHHHAEWHDHAVGVPTTAGRLAAGLPTTQTVHPHEQRALAATDPGALLRPPRA